MLYVPTSDERKLKKIPTLNADTVVLDFEDGVGFNHKVMLLKANKMYIYVDWLPRKQQDLTC